MTTDSYFIVRNTKPGTVQDTDSTVQELVALSKNKIIYILVHIFIYFFVNFNVEGVVLEQFFWGGGRGIYMYMYYLGRGG